MFNFVATAISVTALLSHRQAPYQCFVAAAISLDSGLTVVADRGICTSMCITRDIPADEVRAGLTRQAPLRAQPVPIEQYSDGTWL